MKTRVYTLDATRRDQCWVAYAGTDWQQLISEAAANSGNRLEVYRWPLLKDPPNYPGTVVWMYEDPWTGTVWRIRRWDDQGR